MKKQTKQKWHSHPWTIALGAILVSNVLIPFVISVSSPLAFVDAFKVMWEVILQPISVPLLVLIFVGTWIVYRFSKLLPFYRMYKRDMFFGMIWKWEVSKYWRNTESSLYVSSDDHYCPNCDLILRFQSTNEIKGYHCTKCDLLYFSGRHIGPNEKTLIQNEVARRIRTGEWKMRLLRQKTIGMRNEDFSNGI